MSTSTRLISAALTCCWARRYVFLKESWGFPLFPKTYQRRQKGRKDVFGNGGIRKYLRSKLTNWNLLMKLHASDVWVHQVRVGVMEDENKASKLRVRRCASTNRNRWGIWLAARWWLGGLVGMVIFPGCKCWGPQNFAFFTRLFCRRLGHAVFAGVPLWSWLWNRKGIFGEWYSNEHFPGKYNENTDIHNFFKYFYPKHGI